jgi:hypothetical protein
VTPGSPIDHRGTTFTEALLTELLNALGDPATHVVIIGPSNFSGAQFNGNAGFGDARFRGAARFDRAQFNGAAGFSRAQFSRNVWFSGAQFNGNAGFNEAQFIRNAWFSEAEFTRDAWFNGAQFRGAARFNGAQFTRDAWFGGAQFSRDARFNGAQFRGAARFNGAQFTRDAWFGGAQFSRDARFNGAQVTRDAWFNGAQFTSAAELGPLRCTGLMSMAGALFSVPVTMHVAASRLDCTRTRWSSTATLRIRYATIDLTDAVLTAPVAVTSHPAPFTITDQAAVRKLDETALAESEAFVRVKSIRGVDATNLVLTDIDLSKCVMSGAFHLDHLGLEGDIKFAQPPTGHRPGRWPRRWSRRRTLAEEHHWRARHNFGYGWTPAPDPAASVTGPGALAVTYRAMRKALEDRGDAPGAADFYYGEMDMRRHDRTATRAERGLLTAYWLLSGYGLRASRAMGSLLITMAVTVLTLMLFGLPAAPPDPVTTGVVAAGERIVLSTATPAAVIPPWGTRVSGDRVGQAIPIVLDAVIFRSSDTGLTTTGVYLDMAARLLEPSLLALAVLAIRGRVKR